MKKTFVFLPLMALCLTSCQKPYVNHFKQHLRDPDSYQESSSQSKTYTNEGAYHGIEVYYVQYRAKNGFGGYNNGSYYACKYEGQWVCSECSSLPSLLWAVIK